MGGLDDLRRVELRMQQVLFPVFIFGFPADLNLFLLTESPRAIVETTYRLAAERVITFVLEFLLFPISLRAALFAYGLSLVRVFSKSRLRARRRAIPSTSNNARLYTYCCFRAKRQLPVIKMAIAYRGYRRRKIEFLKRFSVPTTCARGLL